MRCTLPENDSKRRIDPPVYGGSFSNATSSSVEKRSTTARLMWVNHPLSPRDSPRVPPRTNGSARAVQPIEAEITLAVDDVADPLLAMFGVATKTWPQGSKTCRCGRLTTLDGDRRSRQRLWSTVGEARLHARTAMTPTTPALLFSSPCSPAYFKRNDLVTSRQNPASPSANLFLENGSDLANRVNCRARHCVFQNLGATSMT